MSTSTPVSQIKRIVAIDILRGIALLGILLMNIPFFSLPEYFSESFRSDPSTVDFWVRCVITILFEGKMRALFSIIFGAGIILFTINKENTGASATALFYRRMVWLVVFGLIHAHLLLWSGEILFFYGVIGMIAFLFRKMKPVYLVMAIPIVAIMEFGFSTQFYQEIREKRIAYSEAVAARKNNQTLTTSQEDALKAWREVEINLIPNKEDAAEHTAMMKGNYASVAKHIRKISWDGETKYLIYSIWDPLALMLLGIALFKWGFLTLQWKRSDYLKVVWIGYAVGLPLVTWAFIDNFKYYPNHEASMHMLEIVPVDWMALIYPVQRICLVMAHSALVLLAIQSGWFTTAFNRLRAVGQMAFTNYIVHTVICTLVFYGYGLNYYGELRYHQIYYVVIAIWILQLAYSQPWLKHFLFGPLEWLWRSLTYWKIQPMKRK